MRRYVLGLSLAAFTASAESYLRQGCTLVVNPDQPPESVEVYPDGRRQPFNLTHDAALEFATAAAHAFGVGESRTVDFDKQKAKADVKKKDK